MKTPLFQRNQFVDDVLLNGASDKLSAGIEALGAATFSPGLISPDVAVISVSGLVASVELPLPFRVLFLDGALAAAHGNTTGEDTQAYSANFTSLVPGSGSITAYLVAQASTVLQDPVNIIGPPPGHPDYNPGFVPSTEYTSTQDTLSIVPTTTPADNETTFEIFRCTLVSGATGLGTLDFSNQRRASAYPGNPVSPLSGSQILTTSNCGEIITAEAAATYSLPLAADSNGMPITFFSATSGQVIIQTQDNDLIYGLISTPGAGIGSISLPQYASLVLKAILGKWSIVGGSIQGINGGIPPVVVLQETYGGGTNVNLSGIQVWNTRHLNTIQTDTNSICTLSNYQFTLPAGTYLSWGFVTGSDIDDHICRLMNVTDNAVVPGSYGSHGQTMHQGSPQTESDVNSTLSHMQCVFTITATKTFELQHICNGSEGITMGWGGGFGQNNVALRDVFCSLTLIKIS